MITNKKKKSDAFYDELVDDKFDGMYLEEEKENLFSDDEEEEEEFLDEEDGEETIEDMCEKIGVDADILRSVVQENIMPQVIENARLITARAAMQDFKEGSWEKRRLEELEDYGFDLIDAVERVKHEQLKKRIKMLEKQLENRKRTTGSTYSKSKMEFDD